MIYLKDMNKINRNKLMIFLYMLINCNNLYKILNQKV